MIRRSLDELNKYLDAETVSIGTISDLATVNIGHTVAIVRDVDRGGTFIWSSTGVANGGTVFSGTTGFWIRQYSGAVNIKWFGAKGDGITDDTTAIQSCINYVGGTSQSSDIIFEGTFKISSELQIGYANVNLVGSGSSGNHSTGEQGSEANTKFVWAGADGGNMVKYYSPDGVSNQKLIGGGISDIYFDSGATIYGTGASYGVILISMDRLEFNNLTFREFQVKGILLTTTANLFDARDPQHNRFINCWNRNYINQDGGLVYLRGDTDNNPTGGSGGTYVTANVSLNHFENCGAQFYNGVAYELGNSDHNFFINCRANRITGGTGVGVKFRGSNNGLTMTGAVAGTETHDAGFVARKNIFIGFSGGSENVASGTTSFTYPSFKNIFMMMDDSNGTPYPTIETGATCYVLGRTNGIGYYHNTIAPVFTNAGTLANAETMALEARKRVTTESLRVEGRGDGIRLARPSADNLTIEGEWAMSTEATTSNLVIAPVAGNGCVELWSSLAVPVTTFTSSPTLTNLTSSVVLVDATAANRAVGLPLANLVGAGRTFRIDIRRIDASANTCTVTRTGTDTLNGGISELLTAGQGKTYVSDGVSKWFSF